MTGKSLHRNPFPGQTYFTARSSRTGTSNNSVVSGGCTDGSSVLNYNHLTGTLIAGQGRTDPTQAAFTVVSAILTPSNWFDDTCAIYHNGVAIRDTDNDFCTDPLSFDLVALATAAGRTLAVGDVIDIKAKDVNGVWWETVTWTAVITFSNSATQTVNGGVNEQQVSPSEDLPQYYDDGQFTITPP